MDIFETIKSPLILAIVIMLLCGLAYPVVITLIAGVAFPFQANGEQFTINGSVAGSYLIAQGFNASVFFHPEPANFSASGIDPTITLADAYSQVARISNATGLSESTLTGIVNNQSQYTIFFFGPKFINVVQTNLYLIKKYNAIYSKYANLSG
jgi:K+-transporting ATPase ATPase C chain